MAGPPSFYARGALEVLRRPSEGGLFLLSAGAYALGHAAIAVAIAGCVEGLGGPRGATLLAANPLEFALLGLAAVVLKSLGNVLGTTVQARMGGEVGAALREGVLGALLGEISVAQARHSDQGGATKEAEGWARRVTALTEHVATCERGLADGLLATARAVLQMIPLVALLVALAPRLALVAVIVLAPLGWIVGRARRALRASLAREAARKQSLLGGADEAVRHAELFRTFGAGASVRARVRRLGEALTRQSMRVAALGAAISGANEIAGALAVLFVVIAVRSGLLGPSASASLLPFTLTFFMAYRPLRDLAEARIASAKATVAFAEIAPLLQVSPVASVDSSPSFRADALATLEVRGLRLRHGSLGVLDFVIAPGEIVALVAPTGAGKTTLFRTLLGLERPRAGDIRWRGESITDAGVGPSRPFAWCPQESPIVGDSIAANVLLRERDEPGASTSAAREALAAIGAETLARDVGAVVGDGGRALSGGERQWVALARALASSAPVLLLDEPTSGLDRVAQRDVLAAIALLRGKRSILVVSHREEPLSIADRVLRPERITPVAA